MTNGKKHRRKESGPLHDFWSPGDRRRPFGWLALGVMNVGSDEYANALRLDGVDEDEVRRRIEYFELAQFTFLGFKLIVIPPVGYYLTGAIFNGWDPAAALHWAFQLRWWLIAWLPVMAGVATTTIGLLRWSRLKRTI